MRAVHFKERVSSLSIDRLLLVLALAASLVAVGLWFQGRDSTPYGSPVSEIYGVGDARLDPVATPEGSLDASIVPVTLADGRRAQLIIPRDRLDQRLYLRTGSGMMPVTLESREPTHGPWVQSRPVVRRSEAEPVRSAPRRAPRNRRSLDREILIVAGSAGAGAAIGGVAGGGKGAAIGAVSGGVAGLIYDIATRK